VVGGTQNGGLLEKDKKLALYNWDRHLLVGRVESQKKGIRLTMGGGIAEPLLQDTGIGNQDFESGKNSRVT